MIAVRWTVGDVSSRGWEALRLSVHCAVQLFPAKTKYLVCVNSVPLADAKEKAGPLPPEVAWRAVTPSDMPPELAPHLDPHMAEGVGWKLLPLHAFPDRYELALDNDCILWKQPPAMKEFLARTDAALMAEDVDRCLGAFQDSAVPGTVNSGIRGLPPGYPLALHFRALLAQKSILLRSELDEQGLQAAALHAGGTCLRVSREEVTICSPFWPRQPELGTCGAHFVGLNSKHIPWNYYDEPGDLVRRRHWDEHRPALYRRAGLPLTPPLPLDVA